MKVWACVQGRALFVRCEEEGEVAYVFLISLVVVLRDDPCGDPCLERGGRRRYMCTNHVTVGLTDVPCDTVTGVASFCFSGEEGGGPEVCSGVGCGSIVSAGYETRCYS